MQRLLEKIREILRDRRTRMFFTRFVSLIAAIVVFVTTYALVLPAITLEKTASCGLDEHQHSDECYEYVLTCGQEESEGHHHDNSCYTVTRKLECQLEEHQHSPENGCYDEEGNLICQLEEHTHDDDCYSEVKELTCGREESEGHHHTDACYEKVLVCGKEVHTHSKECYTDDGDADGSNEEAADQASSVPMPDEAAGEQAAGAAAEENLSDNYVPELDPLNLEAVLGKETGFYYFHTEEGQEMPANSGEITDWQEVKEDTELAPTDLVKMYLPYTIPAGSLNETNPTARYRLPENIHLTDDQIKAINKNENGIAAGYAESDPEYQKYLGAEVIEGDRTPNEILQEDAQEYISAVVKAENVYDVDGLYGEKGAYLGQDLIFTFVPYSIEKNQITYDAEQNPVSAGEKITGWFACDFRLDQIDWIEKDKQEEIQEEALEETQEEADQSAADTADNTVKKTAEILFVAEDKEEDIEEIKRTLKLVEKKEDTEDTVTDEEGTKEETSEFQSGTLTADGDGYKITLDYTEEAKIPENASLSVREITAETDKEAYEACLAQAQQHVDESGEQKSTVDSNASRFFDIEIQVTNEDGTRQKIEPAAPVSVNIQIADAPADNSDSESGSKGHQNSDPTVLHFAEEGVEQIEATTSDGEATVENSTSESGASSDKDISTDFDKESNGESEGGETKEIRFEAESFSIYGVVYTVDFTYSVDGKTYEFSMPGGGFVSFEALMQVLGVADSSKAETEDENNENVENNVEEGSEEKLLTINDIPISEETKNFVANVESVEFSDPALVWVGKVKADTTVGKLKKKHKLECQYSAELTEEDIKEINAEEVEAGDWALISLKPFSSEESLTVTMSNGDVFTIKVTDAQGTVWNGGADTRSQGITINLFNYGPDSLDNESNAIGGTVSNAGINEHSDLKFLSHGTEGTTINSFTGSAPNEYAAQGIVQPLLVGGYPALQSDHSNQSLAYLFNSTSVSGKTVYEDVNKLMWENGNGFLYDSDVRYAYYNTNTTQNPNRNFTLYTDTYSEEGADQANPFKIGFFPFTPYDSDYHCIHGNDFNWGKWDCRHQGHYDHHFGMTMTATFQLDNTRDMAFHFSGDDDMWVFVDDVLVLDIGGIHNPIDGSINFNSGTVSVTRPNNGQDARRAVDNQTIAPNNIAEAFSNVGKTWNGSNGTYHEIKVFYLERGGMYSNLEVEMKLPTVLSGNLSFDKTDDSNAALKGAKFTLYTDPDCQHPLSFKSEDAVAVSDENGQVSFSGLPVGTYYMKETSAPDGYQMDPNTYIVTIRDKNTAVSEITTLSGTPVSTIVNNEHVVELGVQKLWQDRSGNSIVPRNDYSATFEVVRLRSYTTPGEVATGSENTLQIRHVRNDTGNNNTNFTTYGDQTYKYLRGRTVTIYYDYHGQTSNGGKRQYRYSTNGNDWHYSQYLSDNGHFDVTIPNSGQYYIDFYDANNVVTWRIDDGASEGETVTDEVDPNFSCAPITLTNGVTAGTFDSGLYTGTAKAGKFPVQETINGTKYTYKYYIKETGKNPADAETVYVDSNNNVVTDPASLKTDADTTQTIINKVDTGSLRIHKIVKVNNHDPVDAAQAKIVAGDYSFKIYTDQNCSDNCVIKDGDTDLVLTASIGLNGEAVYSRTITLPVGTYWIKEIVPDDALYLPLGDNPKSITISASNTTVQTVEYTNNTDYNEEDDDMAVDIVKTFAGLANKNQIPDGYNVVLSYELQNGTPQSVILGGQSYEDETTHVHVKVFKSVDELTWTWHVYGIPEKSKNFSIHEENYDIPGYQLSVIVDNEPWDDPEAETTLNMTEPTAVLSQVANNIITAESTLRKFYVSDDYILLVSVNPHGTAVITEGSLNYLKREAIKNYIEDSSNDLSDDFDTPVRFFSIEQHATQIKLAKNRVITVTRDEENHKFIVQLPPNSNSKAAGFAVTYDSEPSYNNCEIVNTYTEKSVPLDIIKVTEDTLDQDTKTYLDGAKFTITQLDENGNGNYKEDPESTTNPKALFYQETKETGSDGKISFSELKTGYYEIKETKPPEGYLITIEPLYIKVAEGKITWIRKAVDDLSTEDVNEGLVVKWLKYIGTNEMVRFNEAQAAVPPQDGNEGTEAANARFTIGNTPGAALPNTGGPGTRLFTILGSILIVGAGALLWRRRRLI